MRVAVLLTTFNRKEKTLTCLQTLSKQVLKPEVEVDIFLTDDNSSDGTAEAVKKNFPYVNIFSGTGHLYWAGGMRSTWRKALEGNYDFYLLLNDDTLLFDTAIQSLVDAYKNNPYAPESAICVGSTCDPQTGKLSYGGSSLYQKKVWKSHVVFESDKYAKCDFANANIMLVPKAVVERIGILSDLYTHSLADYDYTLQAKKAGFEVVLVPGFLGTCTDDHGNNWKSQKSSLKERIKYLKSPKGLAYSEYMKFIKLHFPTSYLPELSKIWLKTFFPFIWDNFKKKPAHLAE
jgi:GT2 family glycosyltransferase